MANRSLLPEAAQTRPWKFRIIKFKAVNVLNSDLFPVGPLLRSLQKKYRSSLSCCTPAQIQQIWHKYLSKSWRHFPLETPTIILNSEVFHHSQGLHCSGVSQRDSSNSSLRGHGHVIHRLQPCGKEQHNRAQAVEECRPLSPCGGLGPIKCLRWHDFSPQKFPLLQHCFEWHSHAGGMVFGFAIAVQWGSCLEWTYHAIIALAEENGASQSVYLKGGCFGKKLQGEPT